MYKTTRLAVALVSSSGICPRRLQRLEPRPSSPGGCVALLRIMLGQLVCWHLLAFFFLPFCLCQDEYMESPPSGGLPPDCSKCCHGDYGFRGYQGPPGPPGPPGIPGNHGNNGNNGATGHEGSKGEKGDKGDLGPRGERGQHGPKGEKGHPGIPPELQIAFMASLATHFSNQNSGIIFSSVETNIGNFFDVMTGRFGAPVSGVYFFTFSMMKHEDVEEVYVYLMHNGNTVFSMYSYETKGKSDTSSNHAVLKLAKGDEVWLRMGNGALHGDHQRFSTFAGFLLFETK
ncbi:complement C1q tumor necrosis factor-related protein 3 [Rhinolophus sinicus]|uniref:complement C1q tumor necrosis factor-related protein 3 n=1 Tax=Rhinolophus sinicus TaxID=89399 RepID=UPI000945A3EA|nr:PREDICTED: complement C1q tumor necrosis factor-related protein 3 isoform X2 [Rhinolophus sinicus]